PPLLTPREAEVAHLAVHHSSREIAERLAISVRTVDNHLAAVYAKLGIRGRGELAEVLTPPR
ncbi:MAG: LuxR family transcriptional regulator, partial [Actinomyces sp.]